MIWGGVLFTAAGCYLLKLLGFAVPASLVERPSVRRTAELLPVALLAALVGVGTLITGHRLALDARAAGVAAALVALALRAPFLVVVLVAASVAALGRLA
jgi:branched-subunit amino acid transport protein